MTSRDWEKELAKIDRQLASMPEDDAPSSPAPTATGMPRGVAAGAPRPSAPTGINAAGTAGSGKARVWMYTKFVLAVATSVGVWFWPWPARCGLPLTGLIAAGAGVAMLGLWSAASTWRHRLGRLHILSLLAFVSGAVLIGREVLPRVGYAYETFDRPARWTCQAVAPAVSPTGVPSDLPAVPNAVPNAVPDGVPGTPPGAVVPRGTSAIGA